MVQYLLSGLDTESNGDNPTSVGGYESAEAARAAWEATGRFNDKLAAEGYFVFANGLHGPKTATVVDGQGETRIFTDGPYVETKEYVIGLWIIDVPDLDIALKLAAEGSNACLRLDPSPIVALNRAIAVAEPDGPEVALAAVDRLDLDGYHAFHATRADLLRRVGRSAESRVAYDRRHRAGRERCRNRLPNPAPRPAVGRMTFSTGPGTPPLPVR